MPTLRFRNNFHNRVYDLTVRQPWAETRGGAHLDLTQRQARKVWSALCGIGDCLCCDSLGTRGLQDQEHDQYEDGTVRVYRPRGE